MVSNGLIAKNYPPTTVDSMVRKYLAGITSTMSPQEFALLAVALAQFGSPPQVLPPDDAPPATVPPPVVTPPPATGAKSKVAIKNGRIGRLGIRVPMRAYLITLSAANGGSVTPNAIEARLRETVYDPQNADYRKQYVGGTYPGGALIRLHYNVRA